MFFFFKTAFAAWVCALREQFVEVRFLTPYDMSNLGQCEGEGCVVCVCVYALHPRSRSFSSNAVSENAVVLFGCDATCLSRRHVCESARVCGR